MVTAGIDAPDLYTSYRSSELARQGTNLHLDTDGTIASNLGCGFGFIWWGRSLTGARRALIARSASFASGPLAPAWRPKGRSHPEAMVL